MCAFSIHKVHGSDDRLCEAEVSQSKPRPMLGAAAAVAAALVMAGYVVLSKQFFGSGGSEVGAFLLARQLLASTLMLALAAGRHGCVLPRPEHRGALARLGFLNFFNAIGFVWGVKLTTAFVTSVMQLSIPVFTLVYSTLTGLEQPSLAKSGALLLTLLGCGIVAVGGAGEHSAARAPPGAWPAPTPESAAREPLKVGGVLILVAQCMSFVGIIQVQKRLIYDTYDIYDINPYIYDDDHPGAEAAARALPGGARRRLVVRHVHRVVIRLLRPRPIPLPPTRARRRRDPNPRS